MKNGQMEEAVEKRVNIFADAWLAFSLISSG
jgi:hypothetical protein